jgi:hypothetical protein
MGLFFELFLTFQHYKMLQDRLVYPCPILELTIFCEGSRIFVLVDRTHIKNQDYKKVDDPLFFITPKATIIP